MRCVPLITRTVATFALNLVMMKLPSSDQRIDVSTVESSLSSTQSPNEPFQWFQTVVVAGWLAVEVSGTGNLPAIFIAGRIHI